jgi:C-terminal processing protease CtpA/Prc
MNKWLPVIIVAIILLNSCVSNEQEDPSSKKISKSKAIADIELFNNILKKAYPSLNLYITKPKLSFLKDSITTSVTGDITLNELYNKINYIANEIGCSHTNVDMPGYVYDTLQNRKFFFPYPVKLIEDKLLVNVVGYDLPQGTEIKYINNEPVKKIIKSLMPYNPVEGFHRKTQQYLATDNFSLEYFYKYGRQQKFELHIKDTLGAEKKVTEAAVSLSEWNNRDANDKYYYDPVYVDYDFMISDTKGYAYLKMGTFEFLGTQRQNAYENFCYNSFELLKNKPNVRSLIIDVRENRGGDLYNCFLLYSFLAGKPFTEFERVIAKIKKIPYPDYLDADFSASKKQQVNDKLQDEFSKKMNSDFYSLADSSISKWQPGNFRFNGNVYVITNSTVVSSGSYFAVMVKNSGRGKIIGEETDGGAYSGNGFATLKYVLPHSKISFSFPYAHLIYNFKDDTNSGHGLVPNYEVPDSYESFKNNDDRQYTFILDSLILTHK